MKDPRLKEWQQRLDAMMRCRTAEDLVRMCGPPDRRIPQRDDEIWHYPLGVVEGSLRSIHAVTNNGKVNQVYIHAIPAGTHVQHGTPEQIELIRHRYWVLRVVWIAFIITVFAGFLIPHALSLHLPPAALRIFGIGYVLCGGLALGVFSIVYWRCPVCKNEFSRQSGGKRCEHCNTKFTA
jgi:hypothetical protein